MQQPFLKPVTQSYTGYVPCYIRDKKTSENVQYKMSRVVGSNQLVWWRPKTHVKIL